MVGMNPSIDQYFTQPWLAESLMKLVRVRSVDRIADFAAGDGSLLKFAGERWPSAQLIAVDRDSTVLGRLAKMVANVDMHCLDFLEAEYTNFVDRIGGNLDLVLLNPPFSVLGRSLCREKNGDGELLLSPAAAFIWRAMVYLRKGGQLIAIVPHGLLVSQRDFPVIEWLRENHDFSIIEDNITKAFFGADVRCAIISVKKCGGSVATVGKKSVSSGLVVTRGKVEHVGTRGRNFRGKDSLEVIHTTNLKSGSLDGRYATIKKSAENGFDKGALVVLPRVGRPSLGKVVLIEDGGQRAFTKCIIAIECGTPEKARDVYAAIVSNWEVVRLSFGGTGAQYTTIDRVHQMLIDLGF